MELNYYLSARLESLPVYIEIRVYIVRLLSFCRRFSRRETVTFDFEISGKSFVYTMN